MRRLENTLNQIAIDNNDIFSVHTDGDTAIRLFDERLITDLSQIAVNATKWQKLSSISLHASSLMRPFFHKVSTFSTLFEYMIRRTTTKTVVASMPALSHHTLLLRLSRDILVK
ncbi:MAG: hypothetical protein ACLU4Q_07880 [Streptococcus thermophilus]